MAEHDGFSERSPTLMTLPIEIRNSIMLCSYRPQECITHRNLHDLEERPCVATFPLEQMFINASCNLISPICRQWRAEASAIIPEHGFKFCHKRCFLAFVSLLNQQAIGFAGSMRFNIKEVHLNMATLGTDVIEIPNRYDRVGIDGYLRHRASNVARDLGWDWHKPLWERKGTWLVVKRKVKSEVKVPDWSQNDDCRVS